MEVNFTIMIYKNAKTFEAKIGDDTFLFVDDDDTKLSVDNMIKLIDFLSEAPHPQGVGLLIS